MYFTDRPGGASSYLFLNNAGESGVVFVHANGVRRLNVLVGPDNDAKIERFGSDGKSSRFSTLVIRHRIQSNSSRETLLTVVISGLATIRS
jgi:hypothetical protein